MSDTDWGDVYGVNTNEAQDQSVPAGVFNCSVNRIYAIFESGNESPGQDSVLYSYNVGEIFRTLSTVSNPEHIWEKRLVAYELAD